MPRVALTVTDPHSVAAIVCVTGNHADDEVLAAEVVDDLVAVTLGRSHSRTVMLQRRLSALHSAGIEVFDFAWLDAVEDPDDRWLSEAFDFLRTGPIEVGRDRLARLSGLRILRHLLDLVGDDDLDDEQRWRIARAVKVAGFNTHTSEAGEALVSAAIDLISLDLFSAMSLLDGAREIADLSRFGMQTSIAEAPLVPLLEHKSWMVHGAATELLAALSPPRSDQATEVLIRLAQDLAGGTKSTQIRAEMVIDALASTSETKTDVDAALDALSGHVHGSVRAHAVMALVRRRPERARSFWEPWLTSRSFAERGLAEWMISTMGEDRDVAEVVRIVEHRAKPPKGTTNWPPLAADGVDYLLQHSHLPEASAALGRIIERWDHHDPDLRKWLQLHHPDLVPPEARV